MKILFLPKYSYSGPSSRYRTYKYIPYFESENILCSVKPLFNDIYMKRLNEGKTKNYSSIFSRYIYRICVILREVFQRKHDLLFIEKELFPYFPSIFEYILYYFKIPYILDYDDAIFHNYDQSNFKIVQFFLANKIPRIIKRASFVITGSPYLTYYSTKFNSKTIEIPTSIDYSRFRTMSVKNNSEFIIGWIGSKSTSKYILTIRDALFKFLNLYDVQLNLVGFDEQLQQDLEHPNIKIIQWTEENEVQNLKSFFVGIMPLTNKSFEKGKCAFKLIQYMAAGIPTISTPLEANIKVDRKNGNLFAKNENEWYKCLKDIYHNKEKYLKVGALNKMTILEKYSINTNYKNYIKIFNQVKIDG